VIDRSREAEAFLESTGAVAPDAVSSCTGWTAHEVVAHVCGIAVEVNRHLDPYLQGDPVPKTRGFDEREAPLRALGHGDLLVRLDGEEKRMRSLVADVLAERPESAIPWTGRQMQVAKFVPHLRNEHALHRWDMVGDDEASLDLLSQSDLTEHSVEVLGHLLLVAGRAHDPEPDTEFRCILHSDGARDLLVVVEDGAANLTWVDGLGAQPGVVSDPAARLLFIWGRLPDIRGRLHSGLTPARLTRLQLLLSGY
jgi:Mycothiol maleylpyruvate isomerase N-terminal domain